MSTLASNALVPALAASLSLLEAQQQQIIARLRVIQTSLSEGDKCGQNEELLPTLTYYVNQANSIQRRMMLIHSRMGDLKRRSERLRSHHSKQNQEMTSWMEQEQSRSVPEAVVALAAPKAQMLFSPSIAAEQKEQGMSSSLPASPFLDRFKVAATTRSARSSPPPQSDPAGLLFDASPEYATSSANSRSRTNSTSNPLRLVNVATSPVHSQEHVRSSSPTPSIASTVDSVARPSGSVPIAMVKRKGKRRVRVPTIE
ncbi:hypothetical protein EV175_001191 [Coemansia sp. RSA 1933]|nr:hypothetical protein EV175_001191 [Coemansia sp. RSA 1933]